MTKNKRTSRSIATDGRLKAVGFAFLVLTSMGCLLLSACHHKTKADPIGEAELLPLYRFEEVLFAPSDKDMKTRLTEAQADFDSPLLNIHPEDPQFVSMVEGFVQDTVLRQIYHYVDSTFDDMAEELDLSISKAMKRAHELCPEISCSRIYTMITGNLDYESRVFCDDHDLVISLDQYVVGNFEKFGYFGLPLYLVNLSKPQYILPDCVRSEVQNHIVMPENQQLTLLDYMILEGKTLYAMDQILPDTPDTLLMRYTGLQWDWMTQNAGNVWSYLIQKNLLYSNDYMEFHNFVEEAPQTNCFVDSAPRVGCYIGWQIVKAYMQKSGASLSDLLKNPRSQEILDQSKWRP